MKASLDAVLAEAAAKLEAAPENGDLDLSSGFITFTPAKAGQTLDVEASKTAVMQGVERGAETVTPRHQADQARRRRRRRPDKVILVRTGENKLYLYDGGKIVKEWPVATGAAGFPTPTGIYEITSKIVNPSWVNPGSAWARGMPKVIGPGTEQPAGHQGPGAERPRHPDPRHVRRRAPSVTAPRTAASG